MTELHGVLTTLNHALPGGVDGSLLAQWRLRDGQTWEQFQSMVGNALDGLNADMLNAWGDMIYVTTDDYAEYPQGSALTDIPNATDIDVVDAYKGTTTSHMLPLFHRHQALGGTDPYFFRDARKPTLNATVRDAVQREINTFEKKLLTRAMTSTQNQIGTGGADVGFADGATTYTTFIPPQVGGASFLSTHTHYIGYNVSTPLTFADVLEGLAGTVSEHGHPAPFKAYIARADVATYRALANFVTPINERIVIMDRGGLTSGSNFYTVGQPQGNQRLGGSLIGYYTSSYGEIALYATSRIPTGYAFLFKSYGLNTPQNALYVRTHPDVAFGWYIESEPSNQRIYPVKRVEIHSEWGVGAGMDRTAGAAGYLVAGGVWANPTIA